MLTEKFLFCLYFKGRSLREGTLRRAHRRSFTPASFIEEDVVDFPDELDTSFFARVSKPVHLTSVDFSFHIMCVKTGTSQLFSKT